jgi:hypothetical protein
MKSFRVMFWVLLACLSLVSRGMMAQELRVLVLDALDGKPQAKQSSSSHPSLREGLGHPRGRGCGCEMRVPSTARPVVASLRMKLLK